MKLQHIFRNSASFNGSRILKPFATAMILFCACFLATADDDIFGELSGMNNVESTYISGRFSHNKQKWYNKSYSHSMDLSGGFSSFYSYQLYSEESVKKAEEILNRYLKNNRRVELMMKSEQGLQQYRVYEKFKDEDTLIQLIIWSMDASNSCEIVVVNWDNGYKKGDSSNN